MMDNDKSGESREKRNVENTAERSLLARCNRERIERKRETERKGKRLHGRIIFNIMREQSRGDTEQRERTKVT